MKYVVILVVSMLVLVITAQLAYWLKEWNKYFTENIDEI